MATHDEVAHAWAHQIKAKRNGYALDAGRVWYRDDTLYSYGSHFPIARFVELTPGSLERYRETKSVEGLVIFFNKRGYSKSTATHKSHVRRAIPGNIRVFEVDQPDETPQKGLQSIIEHIVGVSKLAAETRHKSKRERLLAEAAELCDTANSLRELIAPDLAPITIEGAEAEMEAARRAQEQRKRDEETTRRRQEFQFERERHEQLSAWLRHDKDVRAPHTRIPYLRVNGTLVETSWGAKIPLKDGLRVFEVAKQCRQNHAEATVEGVGPFGEAHITQLGNIKVGCHLIPFKVAQLAVKLSGVQIS